jgi:hypothetical protein
MEKFVESFVVKEGKQFYLLADPSFFFLFLSVGKVMKASSSF